MRYQPFCSLGRLVCGFTGGSCKAMKRKLKLFGSLNREYVTLWDRRQFSCRTAAVFGILTFFDGLCYHDDSVMSASLAPALNNAGVCSVGASGGGVAGAGVSGT